MTYLLYHWTNGFLKSNLIKSETYVIRPSTNFKLSNMFIDFVRVSKDIKQELIGLKSRDFYIKFK